MPNSGRNWQKTASSKRQSPIEAIPLEWRLKSNDVPPIDELRDVTSLIATFLNPLEQHITSANPLTILENVWCSIWSAIAVTQAFCHRTALAHQLVFAACNMAMSRYSSALAYCISEFNFEEACNRAAELDVVLRTTGRLLGLLHGLPISLKDTFDVEDLDSSCGYVSWIGDTKGKDDKGLLVQHLRQAGAIIFVKTNVPMSMLIGETTNNIVGSTLNPYNRALQVGGASGGEGAPLALRGSPFGWGADIAGSIRIPASFNNL
jgi:amidase